MKVQRVLDILVIAAGVGVFALAVAALVRTGDKKPRRPRFLALSASLLLLAAAVMGLLLSTSTTPPDSFLQSAVLLCTAAALAALLIVLLREERPTSADAEGAAASDPLTRVASHRAFQDRLLHECERAYRFGDSFGLLFLDLDQFHLLNNRFGHKTGDRMLAEIAGRLRSLIRDIDLCARFGGDQFVVILPHTLETGGVKTAERLRQAVAAWSFLTPALHEARATASVGLAFYPDDGRTPPELVEAARQAVRFAKSLGGNQVQLHRDLVRAEGTADNVVAFPHPGHGTVVRSLAAAVDVRDRYTHSHSNLVSELSGATARKLGLRTAEVGRIKIGALLHDVGKIGVPDAVLSKEGSLTPDEWEIVRQHPVLGKTIIEQAPELSDLIPMVLHHQERWDGSGYPDGLVGDEIPLEARIIATADAYHAIRSDRPYRSGRTHDEAAGELRRCAGSQFDPRVVQALLTVLETDEDLGRVLALDERADRQSPEPPRQLSDDASDGVQRLLGRA